MKKSQKMRENKNEKVHEMLDQVQLSLLEQQLLNLLLDGLNLRLDLGTLVLSHAEMGGLNIFLSSTNIFRSKPGGDDRSADPAGPPQRLLGPDEHVGDVLVLAQQRDVQQDLQRLADQSEISIVTTNQSQRSIITCPPPGSRTRTVLCSGSWLPRWRPSAAACSWWPAAPGSGSKEEKCSH